MTFGFKKLLGGGGDNSKNDIADSGSTPEKQAAAATATPAAPTTLPAPTTNPTTQTAATVKSVDMSAVVSKMAADATTTAPEETKAEAKKVDPADAKKAAIFHDGEKPFPQWDKKETDGKVEATGAPQAPAAPVAAQSAPAELAALNQQQHGYQAAPGPPLTFEQLTAQQLHQTHQTHVQQMKNDHMSEKEKLLANQQALLAQNQQLQSKLSLTEQKIDDHKKTQDILQQHVDHHKESSKQVADLHQSHLKNMQSAIYNQQAMSVAAQGYKQTFHFNDEKHFCNFIK